MQLPPTGPAAHPPIQVGAGEQSPEMPSVVVGSVGRIIEQLLARRDRYGFSYLVVSDEDMEAFALVVDNLAGQR